MSAQEKPQGHLSDVRRRSYKAFFLVGHLIEESVDAALQKAGVGTQSEYDVLYTLDQAPEGRLTIKELTASLTLSHSGISRMVDRLEERGYVVRCGVVSDRRAVGVRLLDAGRRRIDEVWEAMSAAVETSFAQALTDEEHTELRRLMEKALPPLVAAKEGRTKLPFLHRI